MRQKVVATELNLSLSARVAVCLAARPELAHSFGGGHALSKALSPALRPRARPAAPPRGANIGLYSWMCQTHTFSHSNGKRPLTRTIERVMNKIDLLI